MPGIVSAMFLFPATRNIDFIKNLNERASRTLSTGDVEDEAIRPPKTRMNVTMIR